MTTNRYTATFPAWIECSAEQLKTWYGALLRTTGCINCTENQARIKEEICHMKPSKTLLSTFKIINKENNLRQYEGEGRGGLLIVPLRGPYSYR